MATNIPGLNYDSKLAIDDLKFENDENEKAILDRTRIVFGAESLTTPRFGIIDIIDPRNIVVDETTRPLLVFQSINNTLQVNISSGTAVTENGSIVANPSLIEDFDLARTVANDINVIFIENEIIDSDPVRKTRFNEDQPVRRTQATNVIRVALLTDYQNAVLFPPSRLSNIVVLAVISVIETTSGLELQYDFSSSSYSFNRPWYSPVDIEHRSKLGTGSSTDTNPHGLTFNDLVSGNLTIYDQLLQTGVIQARDDDIKGVPGTACVETIEATRILTDGLGSITSESRFGGAGARYITLARYPVGITAFYQTSHKGRAIAWDHIPGTKIIVLPSPETFGVQATIHYNEVFALELPSQILSNVLTFAQPLVENELIYTGGIALSALTNQFIDFDGSGPVPRNYTIFVKSDGSLLRTPEPIQTTFVLDDLGTSLIPIAASFFGPAKLSIGLADAISTSTMSISIRLYGRDVNNNAITEDITFTGSTWVAVSLPGVETENQFIKTSAVFSALTDIQVLSRTDDGPSSKIQLWAELETGTTQALNNLARAASVSWDGLALANLRDKRQIFKNIPEPINRFKAVADMQGLGGTSSSLTFVDDFACPKLRDTTTGSQTAVAATFQITVNDYTRIQAGDTVLFPTAKTITAIVSGTPNRTIGEYLAATSNQDTRDDIVLTINDGTFDSGFTAVGDATDPTLLTCTANTLGAQGNGSVTEPVEGDPSALLISGDAVGGIDQFGESFTPRHQDYIDTSLPSSGTYDVSNIRGRYLSVPLPVNNVTDVDIILHGVQAPHTNIQLRARYALGASEVWVPWEVLTGDGAFYQVSKTSVITKIQLEIFGRCEGFSLYEV